MLRGAQTLGELKQRSERLHRFDSLEDVERALGELMDRDLVARLSRRPGQKEERYAQLLGDERGNEAWEGSARDEVPPSRPASGADRIGLLEERIGRLEQEIASLHSLVDRLGGTD
jgi:uncharacterized protein YceH (UPF0502 family)